MARPSKRKLTEFEDKVEELEAACEEAQDELHEAKNQYKRAVQVWKHSIEIRNVAEDRKNALSAIMEIARPFKVTPRQSCHTCERHNVNDFQGKCASCDEWICEQCLPLCGLSDVDDPTKVDFGSNKGQGLICGKCVMDQLQELAEEFDSDFSVWSRRACLTSLWTYGLSKVFQ